jgi:hypothetical protein
VNRVDAWGLDWGWGDIASYGSTFATEALRQAKLIGSKLSTSIGVLTAPLGDLLDPTPVNDVYEDTKEYWDKWGKGSEPEDLRSRH